MKALQLQICLHCSVPKKEGSSRVSSSLASGSYSRFGGHSRVSQIMISKSNLGSTSRKNLASDSTRQFKSEVECNLNSI